MHEWRQWLAPGVVVTVVLAMGSLQRADMRELNNRMDQVNVSTATLTRSYKSAPCGAVAARQGEGAARCPPKRIEP